MLLWNLRLLFTDPGLFFLLIGTLAIAMLVAITSHEFGHALVASWLGDPTPKRLGRLSLNPMRHLEPVGTLMVFLVGFGWGKPVPVDPRRLGRDPRKGMAMVALAGPLSNLLLAAAFGMLIRAEVVAWYSPYSGGAGSFVADIVGWIVLLNIILAVFNLIPIAPLDGFRVAVGFLPGRQAYALARMEQYGPMMLLVFVFLGYFTGFLGDFLMWAVDPFAFLFVGKGM